MIFCMEALCANQNEEDLVHKNYLKKIKRASKIKTTYEKNLKNEDDLKNKINLRNKATPLTLVCTASENNLFVSYL